MQSIIRNRLGKTKAVLLAALLTLLLSMGILLASSPEKSYADTPENYTAQINVNGFGTITVELNRKAAPATVDNFVALARKGFYNGLTFHRVMSGFMIQGGDPKGNGTGGSGTNIKGEFSKNGYNNPIKHTRGVISMARGNDYNSASSQFFIMHQAASSLDGYYAAFGKVVSGMDVVDRIAGIAVNPIIGSDGKPEYSDPVNKPVISSIKITEGVASAGWKKSGSRWWYSYDPSTSVTKGKAYPANEKLLINGVWYSFDKNGYMRTGWVNESGTWFYYNASGAMTTGWQKVGGAWYYMNGDGKMVTGKLTLSGTTYFLAESGAMRTGWVKYGSDWYYCNGSGAMITGWKLDGRTWYYLKGDGKMATGWWTDAGKSYFFNGSGAMLTGWVKDDGHWFYCNGSGAMVTGWQKVGGVWYYLQEGNGIMYENAKTAIGKTTYFFDRNGAMQTGWVKYGNDWYYCNGSGAMLTGWQQVGGKWYHMDTLTGIMDANKYVDNYYVNGSGVWVSTR